MIVSDSKISSALRSRIRDLASPAENEYVCTMEFDPGFTGFAGHFEGNPIVPGVCMVEAARVIAEEIAGQPLRTMKIAQCRFRRPVLAGESAAVNLKISASAAPQLYNVRADFRVGEALSAQLRLEAEPL